MKLQKCLEPDFIIYLDQEFKFKGGRSLAFYHERKGKGGRYFEKIVRKRSKSGLITEWFEFVEVE